MGLDDLKLYCLNITSFTVASFDWLEPVLKVLLLATTLGYTVHKWWKLKNEWPLNNKVKYVTRWYKKIIGPFVIILIEI